MAVSRKGRRQENCIGAKTNAAPNRSRVMGRCGEPPIRAAGAQAGQPMRQGLRQMHAVGPNSYRQPPICADKKNHAAGPANRSESARQRRAIIPVIVSEYDRRPARQSGDDAFGRRDAPPVGKEIKRRRAAACMFEPHGRVC